ncbi:MAG: hypothetical protein ACTSRA_04265 [Promethearchaeota archaeon]
MNATVDPEIYYFAKRIEVNKKKADTPVKTNHISLLTCKFPKNIQTHVFEIWKRIPFSKINYAINSDDAHTQFNQLFARNFKQLSREENIIIPLISVKFEENQNPFSLLKGNQLSYLIDSYYMFSDFITFPMIDNIMAFTTNNNLLNNIFRFIDESYAITETLNVKPIMGIISSNIPYRYIRQIVNHYLKLGITAFSFNFEGRVLASHFPHYREFIRTLYKYDREFYDNILIHSFNLKLPSNRNRNGPFPAEDLILPPMGTDVIGMNHLGFGHDGGRRKRRKARKYKGPRRINLLNIERYEYNRIANLNDFNLIFPNHQLQPQSEIIFNTRNNNDRLKYKRKFDFFQISNEFHKIHKRLQENSGILPYLKTKEGILDYINRNIINVKKYTQSRSLEDYI